MASAGRTTRPRASTVCHYGVSVEAYRNQRPCDEAYWGGSARRGPRSDDERREWDNPRRKAKRAICNGRGEPVRERLATRDDGESQRPGDNFSAIYQRVSLHRQTDAFRNEARHSNARGRHQPSAGDMPHPECRDFLWRKHGVMTQVEIEKSALIRTGEAPVDVEESELSRVWMPILTIGALYSNRDNLRCRAHLFAADSAANPLVSVQEAPDQVVSSILPHLHAF
ncbi:hypothetical protein M440DRAFT_1218701 [Trichoderma longibrachiatum ATCC 18648]|uniref:Uncharacterized protein n=1 Tax=Trichoderma longibrachiatum ATCC 18648 TaxID=983965 RepID=A0A2T4C7U4_TRILO|nr:hypothetical protein M440DRAFT_1218701 [Trichoderma longibrachiatum ATCC 18648]